MDLDDAQLRLLTTTTTLLIFGQILVGATMRHTGAGLAIPDFPLMFGGILPDHWDPKIAVHFTHRLGALAVAGAVLGLLTRVRGRYRARRELMRPAMLIALLVATQVTLGALTVLSQRDPWINSLHVVCGALVLTTSLVLTLRTWRVRIELRDGLKAVPYGGSIGRGDRADATAGLPDRADVGAGLQTGPDGARA